MQFLADVTGVELLISRNADCSSLGAAMAAAKGMGLYSSLADVVATVRDAQIVSPAMPRATADALCAGWKRAVGQVLAGVA
jgi:glycerol kinase